MNTMLNGGDADAARRALRGWFAEGLGQSLLAQEKAALDDALQNLFGYHLVQMGYLVADDLLSQSRIRHRLILDPDVAPLTHPQIIGLPEIAPIASDCMDVVVLPHTLEFEADPHQVLREVERILIPEGHVVIVAFNPWSLWGTCRLVRRRSHQPPWNGRYFGLTRIKDWLALLGFDTVFVKPIYFRPPLKSEGVMRRLRFLDAAGERWWPIFAAVNLVVAKKRVATLTPIKLRSLPQRNLLQNAVKPTSGRIRGE